MSVYKFIAWTSPGLQHILLEDLKRFGFNPYKYNSTQFPSTAVTFQSTIKQVFPLMHYTSCITHLNLMLRRQIKARNHRDFMRNAPVLQLHAYLPKDKQIKVRCRVKSSSINNSKIWNFHVERYFNSYTKERLLLDERKEVLSLIERGEDIDPPKSNTQIEDRKEEETKEELEINVYIYRDKASLAIQLHKDSLHKHGFKQYVGKAPMPENIAAALIQRSGLLNEENQNLNIWDPFCGSGTILFNYLQQSLKLPIRLNYQQVFAPFLALPICPREEYEEYINGIRQKAKKEVPNQVYGCDILPFQVKQCFSNIEIFKRKFHLFETQLHKQYPPYALYRSYANFDIIQMDYMAFYKRYLKGKQLFIITNPPWNKRLPFRELEQFLSFASKHTSLVLISDMQWKQLGEEAKKKWEVLEEILQGGHWTKVIVNKRFLATQGGKELLVRTNDLAVVNERSEKMVKLEEEEKAVKEKLKNEKPLRAQANKEASLYMKEMVKQVPRKKLKQLGESQRMEVLRRERRNLNLKLIKVRGQQRKEEVELKQRAQKEKVVEKRLHVSKFDDEVKEKIQKKLNAKAFEKSQEILSNVKKNNVRIPKW